MSLANFVPRDHDGVFTHEQVLATLPAAIQDDFRTAEDRARHRELAAERRYARALDYVCGYHPNGAFLVPHHEIKRLDQYA
ncbi:hypothetical protein [Blastococcus mobilis]|uniref:Uncharacterized protein n=1 Tax=Blastococcus mobilis TaxID=1938746 RepID=A0A238VEV0_9ACTN|nr:hypothetical protein [Blastococcus mobilis]SNR32932.1 hypothetical protein SAMN06272737_10369 [Blastococcus mobilis]